MRWWIFVASVLTICPSDFATVDQVAQQPPQANDTNPSTEDLPWESNTKTAAELLRETSDQAPTVRRPNIIFFLSDDHATQAIRCYGSKLIPTPNIDRIANEGMRFEYCFCIESICGPSRATIMTGKYGHITGAMGWQPYDRQHRTFPEYLQAVGYQTAIVGKYHLGTDPPGFDYYDILPGQGRYHDPELLSRKGKRVERGHVSDVIVDLALSWLNQRDPNRPFAICVHDKATHMPWRPAERFQSLYAQEDIPEPASLHTNHAGRSPVAAMSWLRIDELLRWQRNDWGVPPPNLAASDRRSWIYQHYMKSYLRCVAGLDENIGRVLDWLDQHGLTQDTVVIYASDQGFFLGEHGWFDKRWMMEESIRMPLLMRYPRMINAGSTCEAMVLNLDFAPTVLDLAEIPIPVDMQGRSLRPLLSGNRPSDWRKSMYYRCYVNEYAIPPQYGIRTDRWKLIRYQGAVGEDDGTQLGSQDRLRHVDEWELFDLRTDPFEMINLFQRPEVQDLIPHLQRQLTELQQQFAVPRE